MIELEFNSAGLWNAKVNGRRYIISADDDKAYIYLQEQTDADSRICIETGLKDDLLSTLLEHFLNHLELDSLYVPIAFKTSASLVEDLQRLLRGIGGQQYLTGYYEEDHPHLPGVIIYHPTCFAGGSFKFTDKENQTNISIAKTYNRKNLQITIEKFDPSWSPQAEFVYYTGGWEHTHGPLTPTEILAMVEQAKLKL